MEMTNEQMLAASCRVALAAYLHDLGKFAERAGYEVAIDALDAHITQYCPFHSTDASGKRGYHTHKHAAYTGLAFDAIERTAPDLIRGGMSPFAGRAGGKEITDSLVNAAASHHRPDTFLQWIIATADRVASGFERDEFDQYNQAQDKNEQTGRNHYQARQLTLFEQIGRQGADSAASYLYRYPLQALSPSSIFPVERDGYEPADDAPARAEYAALWEAFQTALEAIAPSHRNSWALWLDHFDTAWLTFTHAIPSATAFGTKPDVSLYDHSKTTAALATALWRWHEDAGKTGVDAARAMKERSDWNDEKFLLIQGDFFGIQDFIFAEGSQTRKNAAKLLRGRSFQVSLFTELAALKVLEALCLPPTSQITNAAGKFLIVAPNTPVAHRRLEGVKAEINEWFLRHSFGLAGLGLVGKPASCNQFLKGNFKQLMASLFADLEQSKLQRFNLTSDGSPVFEVEYSGGVCQYNTQLPADRAAGDSSALSRDQIVLGSALTREDRILVTTSPDDLKGANLKKLEVPIFGYGIAFTASEEASGKFGTLVEQGRLVRCWDFSLPQDAATTLWHGYARRYVNAYVPRFTDIDIQTSDKYLTQDADIDSEDLRLGSGKTLNHIACEDRTCPTAAGQWQGQVALMTLKGDVDNLGSLFQQGLAEPTFAKMASLSRQMNAFFAIWLPAVCKTEFPNIYTVFAGGDDFFLIGPWHSTQQLAARMARDFRTYVAGNPQITFSAGMVMTKPGLPMHTLGTQAEEALETAKGADKNAAVVFGERVRWGDWHMLESAASQLERLQSTYSLSTGYVYGLLHLIDLAADTRDPEHAMWRSRFAYRTRRYVVDKLDRGVRASAQQDLAEQLGEKGIAQLGTRFRIPLFNHFYSQR